MTTEDDFQSALDANPSDWQTRVVFADFLADRGDPRAEGYRALGALRKRAFVCGFDNPPSQRWPASAWFGRNLRGDEETFDLPQDWYDAVEGLGDHKGYKPRYGRDEAPRFSRRQVEDAAALAFGVLPAARRAELLASPPVANPPEPKTGPKPKKPRKPKSETEEGKAG